MANSELSARQHERMMNTPMPRLIAAMALPTTLSQLVTVIYNTADTYFVSKVGTSATAAVGVVFSLMAIIQAVGYGIGMGANSIISPFSCAYLSAVRLTSRCLAGVTASAGAPNLSDLRIFTSTKAMQFPSRTIRSISPPRTR